MRAGQRLRTGLKIIAALFLAAFKTAAQTDQPIYSNALLNGWSDYSWATVGFANTSPVHGASGDSISVNCGPYQALYLHHTAFDSSLYTNLSFWINGGSSGGQTLQIQGTLNGAAQTAVSLPILPANVWTNIVVSLSALAVNNAPTMDGFWIQSQSGATLPTFYVDDISLIANTNFTIGTNATAFITVDAASNRHAISPLIYSVAFATSNQVADLNVPLNRSGGNAETRYNWQIDAHNHAADYYFESIGDSATGVPAASDDSFISASKAGGAQAALTIPMIGWAAKLGPGRAKLGSFSVKKYGTQTSTDQYFPDAGNGISSATMKPITGNDPTDANVATDSSFQKSLIQHLVGKWGTATNGGVRYYLMDNEHSIWHSTHRDIHPVGTTMQEILSKMIDYASTVKSVDSNALVLGPEEWGWSGYLYSGYDQQWAGVNNNYNAAQFPDRSSNGGWDYMPWLLDQIRQHDATTHQRLLDYFTAHCYPQSGEFSDDVSSSMQLLRNRSTRSLWDTNYVDASWINSVVQLIPRLQNWAATYYPGTKVGVTEYNWGAEGYINGATAQADILGIFGRQNLDLGIRWTTPDTSTPTYLAIKMYRNYDGHKFTFGDTSVLATGPNPDNVSTFAALRGADGALTVMVVSKTIGGVTPVTVTMTNFTGAGSAQVWQLNSSNAITRLADVTNSSGKFSLTVPGQSVTLLVLPPSQTLSLLPGQPRSDQQFNFWLNGTAGQTYVVQSSSNLYSWYSISTNTLASTQQSFVLPASGAGAKFYRARQGP